LDRSCPRSYSPTESSVEGDLYRLTTAILRDAQVIKQHVIFKVDDDFSISSQIEGCSGNNMSATNIQEPGRGLRPLYDLCGKSGEQINENPEQSILINQIHARFH